MAAPPFYFVPLTHAAWDEAEACARTLPPEAMAELRLDLFPGGPGGDGPGPGPALPGDLPAGRRGRRLARGRGRAPGAPAGRRPAAARPGWTWSGTCRCRPRWRSACPTCGCCARSARPRGCSTWRRGSQDLPRGDAFLWVGRAAAWRTTPGCAGPWPGPGTASWPCRPSSWAPRASPAAACRPPGAGRSPTPRPMTARRRRPGQIPLGRMLGWRCHRLHAGYGAVRRAGRPGAPFPGARPSTTRASSAAFKDLLYLPLECGDAGEAAGRPGGAGHPGGEPDRAAQGDPAAPAGPGRAAEHPVAAPGRRAPGPGANTDRTRPGRGPGRPGTGARAGAGRRRRGRDHPAGARGARLALALQASRSAPLEPGAVRAFAPAGVVQATRLGMDPGDPAAVPGTAGRGRSPRARWAVEWIYKEDTAFAAWARDGGRRLVTGAALFEAQAAGPIGGVRPRMRRTMSHAPAAGGGQGQLPAPAGPGAGRPAWEVTAVGDPAAALEALAEAPFEILVTDLRLPGMSGLELLKAAKRRHPALRAVLMSAFGEPRDIVEAMRWGADDFLPKPFDLDQFADVLERLRALAEAPPPDPREPWIIHSPAMRELDQALARAADTGFAVLFQGEPGAGKGRAARRLHALRHPQAPYLCLPAPSLPQDGPDPRRLALLQGGSIYVSELERLAPEAARRWRGPWTARRGSGIHWMGSCRGRAGPARGPAPAHGGDRLHPAAAAGAAGGHPADVPRLPGRPGPRQDGRPLPMLERGVEKELLQGAWPGNLGQLAWAVARPGGPPPGRCWRPLPAFGPEAGGALVLPWPAPGHPGRHAGLGARDAAGALLRKAMEGAPGRPRPRWPRAWAWRPGASPGSCASTTSPWRKHEQRSPAEPPSAAAGQAVRERVHAGIRALCRVVVGKDQAVRRAVAVMLAGGHLLIEDLPGVGKTTLAKGLSRLMGGTYQRVQGTNDLLPSDLLGIHLWDAAAQAFRFQQGPVFANVLLLDELNRIGPKTQSALLEVMVEGQVTLDRGHLPAAGPVLRHRHPEPHGPRRHLPAAREPDRPVRLRPAPGLPRRRRRAPGVPGRGRGGAAGRAGAGHGPGRLAPGPEPGARGAPVGRRHGLRGAGGGADPQGQGVLLHARGRALAGPGQGRSLAATGATSSPRTTCSRPWATSWPTGAPWTTAGSTATSAANSSPGCSTKCRSGGSHEAT